MALPEGLEELGAKAFFGCRSLRGVFIPESCQLLGGSKGAPLFDNFEKLHIYAPAQSAAALYAQNHRLPFQEASAAEWRSLAQAEAERQRLAAQPPAAASVEESEEDAQEAAQEKKSRYLKRIATLRAKKGKRH